MLPPSRRKSTIVYIANSRIALSDTMIIHIVFSVVAIAQIVVCSPPIDFFVYTSQLENIQQNSPPQLPTLESIYSPFDQADRVANAEDKHMEDVSHRVLSLIQNISHTHDNDLVDLEATRLAWRLMERQALLYMTKRVHAMKPFINVLLDESGVSKHCKESIDVWMGKLTNLDKSAMLMWNSWGEFPPAGLYEGSFTDLGSYRGCLSIPDSDDIGQAQYCTLDYQPLVPTRPRFHSIFKKILDIDPSTGQLTGGDFNTDRISSNHSAHGFSSSRFRSAFQKEAKANGSELALSDLNATITTGAMIELAQKAQYFYYVKFRVGACLPAKCTQDDVQKLAKTAGQRAILQANPVNCMKKEPMQLNGYQKTAIWVLSTLALIAVLGTIIDLLGFKASRDSSSLPSWLLPFSIWTNARRLFDSDSASTHADLECIHGLRFFSMIWVIYGHTILYTEYQSFTHFFDVVETQIPSFLLLPSLNANFSVDTFFVISGILTTYVTWEYMKGDPRKFNKLAFAISRYIRLTPQFAIVILCFFLLPLLGDGPMYKQVTEAEAKLCYDKWYINLLYLQTYWNSDKLCIDPSWWLSIEMTFHLLSMFVIVVMIKNATQGMIVNFCIAAALTFWGAIIHYSNGFAIQYLPSIPQRYEVPLEQGATFFHRPYPHAASYFIGIALGYVLANRSVKKLSRAQVVQGWVVCAFGLITSLWGSYYWNLGASYTQIQATLYYNLCQILWPISIAWIILASSLGHGGIVESILSARCFVPLGRITYMTYLSHALIIYYHSASMSIPVEPSMLQFIYIFLANTFLSLALGVLLTVLYESPILNLQKQLFTYLTKKFDPTNRDQPDIPRTIVCDKNGTSAASVMLLPNNKLELINGTDNSAQKP